MSALRRIEARDRLADTAAADANPSTTEQEAA